MFPKRYRLFALLAFLLLIGLIFLWNQSEIKSLEPPDLYFDASLQTDCFLPPLATRNQLGFLLEKLGFNGSGAEVGVDRGHFSKVILSTWKSCERLYLVDPWPDNYDSERGQGRYEKAMKEIEPWRHKTVIIRENAQNAAVHIEDQSLDFVYVDALHDYCSVSDDIAAWWSKLKPGGVMAGHDYASMLDLRNTHSIITKTVQLFGVIHKWHLCANGTVEQGAVKAALQRFAQRVDRALLVTYENDGGNEMVSWTMRK